MKSIIRFLPVALFLGILLTACGPSPWSGPDPSTPTETYAKQSCECLNKYLNDQGIDTGILLSESVNFAADREQVNKRLMTEEDMRAKYPQQFEVAESLPEIMKGYPDYPCNVETREAVKKDSLNLEVSDVIREHCLLTTYFKR